MQGIDETLLSQLEAGFKLPVKPAALEQLQAELNRNDPSIDVVSELIATDVAMSATVRERGSREYETREVREIRSPAFTPSLESSCETSASGGGGWEPGPPTKGNELTYEWGATGER